MARRRATITDLLNDLTFKVQYDKWRLVAINEWEYSGLPEGITERHLEKLLYSYGKACFFRDPNMSYMVLECDQTGHVNVYGEPLRYRVHGFNYQREVSADKCVIIRNNKLNLPTDPFIMHYVNKITEAERTMDVNVKACKTPVIFACDSQDVLSFKRLFQQVDGNTPAIFADKGLNIDAIQSYQTGAKFMGNDLMDYKRAVESDLLTFLGLNNTPVDKKERLITDEAEANNQLIESFADLQLQARQEAVDEINKMFSLSITVKRRQLVNNSVDSVESEVDQDDVV